MENLVPQASHTKTVHYRKMSEAGGFHDSRRAHVVEVEAIEVILGDCFLVMKILKA